MNVLEIIIGIIIVYLLYRAVRYIIMDVIVTRRVEDMERQKLKDKANIRFENIANAYPNIGVFRIQSGFSRYNHNILQIERLNAFSEKFKKEILSGTAISTKIELAYDFSKREIAEEENVLFLQVLCYGYVISEYFELVEGVRLAFNEAGIEFNIPSNEIEMNKLWEKHLMKEVQW